MGDLLIKNMKMPKKCEDCFACYECSKESFDYCNILKDTIPRGERRKDCPLVEVKPHGRLIDATELEAGQAIDLGKEAWDMVHNAPTVLEAST